MQGDEALAMLEHASRCPECAQALKSAIEIFAPEEMPSAQIATPKTVPIDSPPRPSKFALNRWVAIAAVLVGGAVLGYVVWQKSRSADPLTLLAQAYSSHRTLDLRLPGAAWGPMRVQRGGASDLPTEAVGADLALPTALVRNPNNPRAPPAPGGPSLRQGPPAA